MTSPGTRQHRRWRSLVRKNEFQSVYQQGAKRVGRFLVVYLLWADDFGRAFVASRKVGNAVARNRAKRLLRESFRHSSLGSTSRAAALRKRLFPSAPDGPEPGSAGLWVALVARHAILSAGCQDVRAELDDILAAFDEAATAPDE